MKRIIALISFFWCLALLLRLNPWHKYRRSDLQRLVNEVLEFTIQLPSKRLMAKFLPSIKSIQGMVEDTECIFSKVDLKGGLLLENAKITPNKRSLHHQLKTVNITPNQKNESSLFQATTDFFASNLSGQFNYFYCSRLSQR